MNILHKTAELLREANKQIQEANNMPDNYAYEDKLSSIEDSFKEKVAKLLYPLI